jgi:hypothetical protein
MYAVIRKYRFDPSASQEISRQIQEGLVPLLRQTPGFVGYYWLDTGKGEGASLNVFEDQAGAEKSNRIAADFVQQHLASQLGKPEITQGRVLAHA